MKEKIKIIFISLRNMVIWIFPLLAFLAIAALIYFLLNMSWEEFIEFLKVLMWPVTILIILFFFRKIFTYLFFSMEEFNFFGIKGELKNVNDFIEEKVNQRLLEGKKEQERILSISKIAKELEKANSSKESFGKMAKENFDLAKKIFSKYEESSMKNEKLLNELSNFRKKEQERKAIIAALENRNRRRHSHNEPSQKEIDDAGDAWIQDQIDQKRGK